MTPTVQLTSDRYVTAAVWQVYGEGARHAARVSAYERSGMWPRKTKRYVLVHAGEYLDETDDLPPPAELVPGVYAVDIEGLVLVTAGGDPDAGAQAWRWVQEPEAPRTSRRWIWVWILTALGIAATLVLLRVAGLVAQGAMLGEAGNSTLRD